MPNSSFPSLSFLFILLISHFITLIPPALTVLYFFQLAFLPTVTNKWIFSGRMSKYTQYWFEFFFIYHLILMFAPMGIIYFHATYYLCCNVVRGHNILCSYWLIWYRTSKNTAKSWTFHSWGKSLLVTNTSCWLHWQKALIKQELWRSLGRQRKSKEKEVEYPMEEAHQMWLKFRNLRD